MNKIVEWAINWPDANINQIELFALQGHDENKLRRNRFYEQFGIKFDYTDSTHTEGTARPMQARSLTPLKQLPKNLSVISLDEFLDEQEKCLSKTKNDLENQQKLNERLNSNISHAYDHIIWFAAKTIWEKHFKFLLGTIIFCAAIWHWW
ncbi:hypothetical protein [Acetobacter sp. LMG 32666]|uniref:hypothetical protein n=1 Tax=Acetobacter sp. LMG 32666 TaxID=2959295 RepID=UPI0030C7C74A